MFHSCFRLALVACFLSVTLARFHSRSQLAASHLAAYAFKANDNTRNNIRPTPEEYNADRSKFFRYEESMGLGAEIELNDRELQANQIIMAAKGKEYEEGLVTPHLFKPSKHFFSVLEAIAKTQLFSYMQAMPKGGVLHSHDTAMCSTDFLIKLTYRDNLWVCESSGSLEAVSLRFARTKPAIVVEGADCAWTPLATMRSRRGAAAVDNYLRERFTLYPKETFLDNNEAWKTFMEIFSLLDGLLTYAPVWADYYYNALKEFRADGVQYLEFRSTLPQLYDLDDGEYTELDTVRIYTETLEKFMKEYPDFIGSKMIYAPIRNTSPETVEQYIRICIEIKAKYPDFVAGFDLVGQEELGRPLKDFIPQLLSVPADIDFYFHAGETNWNGAAVDENLIDAVLLGTKRIGHGFALTKHPHVLQALKERNIPVEINPISNQVLQLVTDYRNHPCSHLFSDNFTVVISSDDPSFWRATPLSHDFYIAFLGIASAHADMRLLKKLAINSLVYSALNEQQQELALQKWQLQWDKFIEKIIEGDTDGAAGRLQTNRID
ncbi:adenosine deaminase 2 [Zeugodacus cucurbitae]|uniref:Adenosine deaminase n=1 Tax=Zeugodacus cucurbitae TaxID=28588 RepID=A0A0A1X851_ZEUCU|nr:adenosine deaminase 2 [Zeugodacus cucurbitae]XP_054084812.1 adenosine deaminase 2 [Zeugodacus cucurbitae]XP_054084813.1 adenosine deaminase 2 [Zeugodacus cucurbitae]